MAMKENISSATALFSGAGGRLVTDFAGEFFFDLRDGRVACMPPRTSRSHAHPGKFCTTVRGISCYGPSPALSQQL